MPKYSQATKITFNSANFELKFEMKQNLIKNKNDEKARLTDVSR